MRTLYLMRHAEARLAPGQPQDSRFSLGDLPLSERGIAQAQRARDLLNSVTLDAIYASPMHRARETAAIVGEPHDLAPVVAGGLREFPLARPGMDYPTALAEILALPAHMAKSEDVALPGGSTYVAERDRFSRAMDDILARHERALVVAHGVTNRAWLAARVLDMPPRALFRIAQPHACITVVGWDERGPAIVAHNPTWPVTPPPG